MTTLGSEIGADGKRMFVLFIHFLRHYWEWLPRGMFFMWWNGIGFCCLLFILARSIGMSPSHNY